jgi:beta-galactosidase
MTDRAPFSTSLTDTPNVGATELRNPSNGAGFYVVRHSDLKTTSTVDLKLKVRTNSNGNLTIPINAAPIRLAGQQSKVIVTDFHFGNNTLVYSTAEVLSHSIIDGQSVLALWLPEGESGEFAIKGGSKHRQVVSGTGGGFHEDKGKDLLTTSYKQQKTTSVLQFDNFRVLLVPHKLAYKFWAPTLTNDPIVPADKVLFVTGPYLVRSAEINKSAVLITGDIDANTELEIYAPSSVNTISWNGKEVKAQKTSYGSLKANLKMTPVSLDKDLALDGWKYSDALPEAGTTYDDSNWVVADHTATPNPTKPKTLPVLYADDYGTCTMPPIC